MSDEQHRLVHLQVILLFSEAAGFGRPLPKILANIIPEV